jgi:type IV/VI secretion system ImpK/VasF family protein
MTMSGQALSALRTAYVELFWLAARLRTGAVPGTRVLDIRNLANDLLLQQRRVLRRADVDDAVIGDAELALIALLDESAQLSADRDCAEQWMSRLLQYEHYKHSNLGRDFFERLEALRQRADTPLPLLELYARALAWGLQGRYRQENRTEDLRVLRDALRAELLHRLPEPPLCSPLSAHVAPPKVAPLLAVPWVLAMGATLILLVGVVLAALLSYRASTTTAALLQLTSPAAETKE